MKRLIAVTLALLALTVPAAQVRADETPADLLSIVPADAWAVVSVRNLGDMDKKLNTMIQQLTLPIPFQAPLTQGLAMAGFMNGVNGKAGIGVAIMPAPSFEAMKDGTVFYIPCTSFDELLGLMEPEKIEGEENIRKVLLQNSETFVAQRGSYALLSASLDAIKAALASKVGLRSKLHARQIEFYEQDDLTIWGNLEAITSSDAFKALAPMLQMMNIDVSMFEQIGTGSVSLALTPAGIKLALYTDGRPGTKMHAAMSNQPGSSDCLLLGLPREGHVLSYGGISSKETAEITADMLLGVLNNPQIQMLGLNPEKLEQIKGVIVAQMKTVRSASFGVSALPEGPDGMITMTKVVGTDGDPKSVIARFAEMIELVKGGLLPEGPEVARVLQSLEYRPAAETIDGVTVDHLVFDLAKLAPQDDPSAAAQFEQWTAMIAKIVGKDGLVFRMGVVDDQHIAATFGGGAERFKMVAGLVRAKQTPLDQDGGIQRSRKHLPTSCYSHGFLSVDRLLDVISSIAKVIGEPMPPIALGELNAPIAFGGEPTPNAGSRVELFLPMELVVAVKDMAMNSMAGGGPAPQPGAGAEPAPAQPGN